MAHNIRLLWNLITIVSFSILWYFLLQKDFFLNRYYSKKECFLVTWNNYLSFELYNTSKYMSLIIVWSLRNSNYERMLAMRKENICVKKYFGNKYTIVWKNLVKLVMYLIFAAPLLLTYFFKFKFDLKIINDQFCVISYRREFCVLVYLKYIQNYILSKHSVFFNEFQVID